MVLRLSEYMVLRHLHSDRSSTSRLSPDLFDQVWHHILAEHIVGYHDALASDKLFLPKLREDECDYLDKSQHRHKSQLTRRLRSLHRADGYLQLS